MVPFHKKISRRGLLQALLGMPMLSLLRRPAAQAGDPDEVVEVNGWILKRSDLA